MVSWADAITNVLDLIAFFLVAPGVIGEARMRRFYDRWFGFFRYLHTAPPWSPGVSRWGYIGLLLPMMGLLVVLTVPLRQPTWVLVIYYFIAFVVMLLSTLTVLFDMAMKRRSLIRVMALWGTALFVLGKAVAIGKAAGLWS